MEPDRLTAQIGAILRRLRKERGWTLDRLAEATGVSKPMLGQIERGESNPTVVTLWKIATGLGVPFSTFLQPLETPQVTVVRREEQPVVADDGGGYVVRSLLAIRHPHAADVYDVRLASGCVHAAEAHGPGVSEGLWVREGVLTLVAGEHRYTLTKGDAAVFRADLAHVYENGGDGVCEFTVFLTYARAADSPLP
ncbi:helix-turn-helix domain-containing protein [Alicyclobacillus macrosporangiidus]|uniref:helix-turn-helix domain-containing protein n=1 Tax=Alicyclobacillus macrosporangiidus TaxID=392015 RepID=UPI000690D992|nr:XRE family transcriptional regulator [Alicyclobacillus macrosporangiidus]